MIKATFYRDEKGDITRFTVTGHAAAGDYGQDIVCAAVSAVTIGTVNGIDNLAAITPVVDSHDQQGGYLNMRLPRAVVREKFNIAQILLENLLLELKSIADSYADHVTVATRTVQPNK